MKRKMIAGLIIALLLALSVPTAFAADTDKEVSPAASCRDINFDRSQLSDDELKQIDALHDKIVELRKQMIRKYAEFGAISQEDADTIIKRIDEKSKLKKNPGFWHGKKHEKKGGFSGSGE